jgi:hypothetical protein
MIFSSLALAQQKVVPIVEMKVGGLLGGVENGKFIDAKTTAARLKGDENYTLYLFNGKNENGLKLKKPENSQDVCDDFYYVESDEESHKKGGVALGAGYRWNPVIRASQSINLDDATYKKAVADVLRTKGITKTTIKLTQAVRVDLEGDGQEEVLISATRYSGDIASQAKRGDYSFVMLRKIVGGKAQNILIGGDFVNKNVDFGAPSTYEISAIADLNGDGKMEVIIHSAYYEGSYSSAYEIKGNKLTEIKALAAGCGV